MLGAVDHSTDIYQIEIMIDRLTIDLNSLFITIGQKLFKGLGGYSQDLFISVKPAVLALKIIMLFKPFKSPISGIHTDLREKVAPDLINPGGPEEMKIAKQLQVIF